MDVQADVGHVVKVLLARNKPDDLADFTLGIVLGQARKGIWVDCPVLCKLCHIVQSCPLCIGKNPARAVLCQRVKFGLAHRCFDRDRAAYADAE
jgi:hypothetical protein